MECITCKSARVSRFVDGFGHNRVFCKSCWVSFPEPDANTVDPRPYVHINFGAVRRTDSY